MELKIGMQITAENIYKKVVTGNVTSILVNSAVVENETGRHVIKNETLKERGYSIGTPSRYNSKRVHIHIRPKGK